MSLTESWASGNGVPAAHWQLTDRTVVNLSSHGAEYLMFGVPLRGNFTFECECTGFGYKDCHPSVAGSWIAPVYDHDSFQIGNLLTERPAGKFRPKLSQVDEWIRYRIQIKDGVCSRFINGRLTHKERLLKNDDPWVAIRSPNYGTGHVPDIRITGNPVILREVDLTSLSRAMTKLSSGYQPAGNDSETSAFPEGWMP